MNRIFKEKEILDCFKKWIKLGWGGEGKAFRGHVDLEKLIIETTHIGRVEGRLFKAMLTWVRDYHDLINVQRLLHYIQRADKPVLGAVCDIAIKNGADIRLKTILKQCKPYKPAQVLFGNNDDWFIKNQKEFGKKDFKEWGLFCTALEFYDDAMYTKKYVLQHNPQLAIRALIGANIRSEILFELLNQTKIHISALAKNIDYAYSAVYREIMNMISNEFISVETYGRVKVLSLNSGMVRFLRRIPV